MGSGGISDHRLIYLEIRGDMNKPKGPFKFNDAWLRDVDYIHLVTNFWRTHPPAAERTISEGFSENLKELKSLSKKWAHKKRTQEYHILNLTKEAIEEYENECEGIFSSLNHKE